MKRLSCFLLALGLALTLVLPAVPAAFADYQSESNLWQWIGGNSGTISQKVLGYLTGDAVCPDSNDGKHHASHAVFDRGEGHYVCTCDYCGDTFVATYSDLDTAYGNFAHSLPFSNYKSNGSFFWSPTLDDLYSPSSIQIRFIGGLDYPVPYNDVDSGIFINGEGSSIHLTYEGSGRALKFATVGSEWYIVAPISGTYTCLNRCHLEGSYYISTDGDPVLVNNTPSTDSYDVQNKEEGQSINWAKINISFNQARSVAFGFSLPTYSVVPATSFLDSSDSDYHISTRSSFAQGDYFVVGDNGEVIHHEETIFNEDNSTFYNPVTDTSTHISNFVYDYSTRTYTLTDDNGENHKVRYGDDSIYILDGGNSFNVYYGDGSQSSSGDSGSGESGSGGSGTGLIAQVGQLLGTLVSGLLGGITAFLSAILSALTNLVEVIGEGFNGILEAVLGWFAELPQLFHGFLEFLTAVFGYMPAQILSMLSFGVAAVVFVGILKALRR